MSTLATVDKSQKGFVDRVDFIRLLCNNNDIDERRAVKIFQLIDDDGDGRISYTQMLRVVRWRTFIFFKKIYFSKISKKLKIQIEKWW